MAASLDMNQRLMGNDKIALTQLNPRPARIAFRPEFG